MLNTKNIEFQFIEVRFTDQNSKQLEIEHNVNIIPVLRQILSMRYFKLDIQQNQNTGNMLKDMAFCHSNENLVISMVKN